MRPEADDLVQKWQKIGLQKRVLRRRWLALSIFIPLVLVSFQNCESTTDKIKSAAAIAND